MSISKRERILHRRIRKLREELEERKRNPLRANVIEDGNKQPRRENAEKEA